MLALCASLSIMGAHAATSTFLKGSYLGVQMGNSETHYSISAFNTNTGTSENGNVTTSSFGQRALVGYQFTRYLATEAGYTHYGVTNANGLNYSDGALSKSGEITENSVDLGLKGILPIADELHLYGKLGIAYLWTHTTVTTGYSKNNSTVSPMFGVGAGYNVNKNFVCDVFYNRIQSDGDIKSADLIGVGFYYYI